MQTGTALDGAEKNSKFIIRNQKKLKSYNVL